MMRVLIESPFAGTTEERKANITYLRSALRDSLFRGEAPFASHAIYTQYGVLDDSVPEERKMGIEAGLLWGKQADITAVYVDRGISVGMRYGIIRAYQEGRQVVVRAIECKDKDMKVAANSLRKSLSHLCECGHMSSNHDNIMCADHLCPCTGFARLFFREVEISVRRSSEEEEIVNILLNEEDTSPGEDAVGVVCLSAWDEKDESDL